LYFRTKTRTEASAGVSAGAAGGAEHQCLIEMATQAAKSFLFTRMKSKTRE
jgi:hypothetical protein